MPIVIVPNELRDKINQLLDEKIPEEAKPNREFFYKAILQYYYDKGHLPEFTIRKTND